MTGQKVYCIVYKAHEMGDFYDDGNIRPVYYTLDKDDLEKTWEELKNKELEFFYSCKERAKQLTEKLGLDAAVFYLIIQILK